MNAEYTQMKSDGQCGMLVSIIWGGAWITNQVRRPGAAALLKTRIWVRCGPVDLDDVIKGAYQASQTRTFLQ